MQIYDLGDICNTGCVFIVFLSTVVLTEYPADTGFLWNKAIVSVAAKKKTLL
jgi:hypothetical protein